MKGNETRKQRMKWSEKTMTGNIRKWNKIGKKENSLEKLHFWNGIEWSTVKWTKTSWSDTQWNCEISFPFVKWRNFITAGYWDFSLYTFGIWASHGDGDYSSSDKLPLGFRLGFRELQESTAPGKLGLEKACQGDPDRTPILLLLHLSNLDLPWWSETQPQWQDAIKPTAGVKRGREPRAPETLGWKMHAKRIMVGAQHCCLHTLQIRAIHGDGHLSYSPKIAKRLEILKWSEKNGIEWDDWNIIKWHSLK